MRKLKLQMQLTTNGYVAGPNGEMNWMTWNWDDELKKSVTELTASIDLILLGRKLADGFIPHWASATADKTSPEYEFAIIMHETPKIVFSKTLDKIEGNQTTLEKGDAIKAIQKLKEFPGKDIIIYGGASFTSFLIANNLIDEFHLFINPTAIANGLPIFNTIPENLHLKLVSAKGFSCGITELYYKK